MCYRWLATVTVLFYLLAPGEKALVTIVVDCIVHDVDTIYNGTVRRFPEVMSVSNMSRTLQKRLSIITNHMPAIECRLELAKMDMAGYR